MLNLTKDEMMQYANDSTVVSREQLLTVIDMQQAEIDAIQLNNRRVEIDREQLYFARELLSNILILNNDRSLTIAKLRKEIAAEFENSMLEL